MEFNKFQFQMFPIFLRERETNSIEVQWLCSSLLLPCPLDSINSTILHNLCVLCVLFSMLCRQNRNSAVTSQRKWVLCLERVFCVPTTHKQCKIKWYNTLILHTFEGNTKYEDQRIIPYQKTNRSMMSSASSSSTFFSERG